MSDKGFLTSISKVSVDATKCAGIADIEVDPNDSRNFMVTFKTLKGQKETDAHIGMWLAPGGALQVPDEAPLVDFSVANVINNVAHLTYNGFSRGQKYVLGWHPTGEVFAGKGVSSAAIFEPLASELGVATEDTILGVGFTTTTMCFNFTLPGGIDMPAGAWCGYWENSPDLTDCTIAPNGCAAIPPGKSGVSFIGPNVRSGDPYTVGFFLDGADSPPSKAVSRVNLAATLRFVAE